MVVESCRRFPSFDPPEH